MMIARNQAAKGRRILVVDDHAPTLEALEEMLNGLGYTDLATTVDSRRVLTLFRDFEPDLLLVDLHMPGLDGIDVLRQIGSRVTEGEFLPVVVLSGDTSTESRERALTAGASDFIAKPIVWTELALRLRNLLRLRELTGRLEEEVRERVRELREADLDVANRLASVSEYRDYPDHRHVQRVGRIAALLASAVGQPEDEVALMRYAAPLHDIGKVAVPESILLKPGALTKEEADVVKAHTTTGARMLSGSRSPILQMAEEIALYHHENWDGSGYTRDLSGDDIPLSGRIVAVADVFDALTHPRPYKQPWTTDQAITWMESMRARKFDPGVLDALLLVLRDSDEIAPGESEADLFLRADRPANMPGATAGQDAAAWPTPPDGYQA
jgi:putative two-component system response regulator